MRPCFESGHGPHSIPLRRRLPPPGPPPCPRPPPFPPSLGPQRSHSESMLAQPCWQTSGPRHPRRANSPSPRPKGRWVLIPARNACGVKSAVALLLSFTAKARAGDRRRHGGRKGTRSRGPAPLAQRRDGAGAAGQQGKRGLARPAPADPSQARLQVAGGPVVGRTQAGWLWPGCGAADSEGRMRRAARCTLGLGL